VLAMDVEEHLNNSNDHYLAIGTDLDNPYFKRYVKYSSNSKEHCRFDGDIYFGEWSQATNKPDGRGILIDDSGILFRYFCNGKYANGKSITIKKDGKFRVC
jgi:hypothetical protein